jgi:hypothetical protein
MRVLLLTLLITLNGCTTYNIDASIHGSFNNNEPKRTVYIRDPNNPYKNIK